MSGVSIATGVVATDGSGGGGSGTVTSVSVVTANGVSAAVANPTTTPAITVTLGAITPTTVNGLTISTSTGTLTVANGKTVVVSNGLTLAGTDGTTMTFPATSATVARTDAAQTFTGVQTFSSTIVGSVNGNAATVTTNANLTGVITSSGNATSIASQTGTGTKFVVDTSPTLVTPVLGVATATSVNKVTITAPATGSTLTIQDGFTLTVTANATISGTPPSLNANTFVRQQTITQGTANEGILASTGYSVTGANSTNMVDLAGTWNTSGTPTGLNLTITETAKGAASSLIKVTAGTLANHVAFRLTPYGNASNIELRDGASIIDVSSSGVSGGDFNFAGACYLDGNSHGLRLPSAGTLFWNSTNVTIPGTADCGLSRTTSKVVELNSGVAGTYTGTAVLLGPQTVAQLPVAATALKGARATVTDATATTFLSIVAGTGANIVPVFCNGTNWLIG